MSILIVVLYDLLTIYSWVLIIYALLSWAPRLANSAFGRFVARLVNPYLSIFDKIPTRFGLFDFKVLLGWIVLMILQRFLLML